MKLGIGTAQFGLEYGISNHEGKTSLEEVAKILDVAVQNGVRIIDTAPAYGTSEEVLGMSLSSQHSFDIVTKTPKFSKYFITSDDAQFLEDTFYKSLSRLNQLSLYGLLLHHADDLVSRNGHLLMEKMLYLKNEGLVEKIGVSVYTQKQIDNILERYSVDVLQVPINVLDQRLVLSGHLRKMKKLGIEIHARSIFLQGLLLMNPEHLPSYFDSIKNHLKSYCNLIFTHGISQTQAALSFVTGLTEIDVVLFGVTNCKQLHEVILEKKKPSLLTSQELARFALTDKLVLNPSEWKI